MSNQQNMQSLLRKHCPGCFIALFVSVYGGDNATPLADAATYISPDTTMQNLRPANQVPTCKGLPFDTVPIRHLSTNPGKVLTVSISPNPPQGVGERGEGGAQPYIEPKSRNWYQTSTCCRNEPTDTQMVVPEQLGGHFGTNLHHPDAQKHTKT